MTVAPGERLGDWVVESALGEGGMGSVYRCHSVLADDVHAAVKVLKRGQAIESLDRFVQELRTLSALHHPAIVRVLGGGRDEKRGLAYMAMELVEGQDLSDRLVKGPLTSDEAAAIFGPVADALAYAHHRGVAHRDIKPSNIMLRADGSPVIVDFGIAVAEGRARHTKEGLVPGTVVYLPPEIFEGNKPDPKASDAYALGVVIWESLTGKHPFDSDPSSSEAAQLAQVMGQKLRSDALDPGGKVPSHMREAIRRTTDPSPVTRLVDLGAVRDLLTTGKLALPPRRRRSGCALALGALTVAGGGVSVIATIAAVGVGAWWIGGSGGTPLRPTVDLAATLEEAARALEGSDVAAARRAAGLAIDDHADDPHANLLYGQTLLADGDGLLARPYLCAAVEGGLGGRVPGHASGDLVCERGPGGATPLVDPLALARVDLSEAIAVAGLLAQDAAAPVVAEGEAATGGGAPTRSRPMATSSASAPAASAPAPAPAAKPAPAPRSSPSSGPTTLDAPGAAPPPPPPPPPPEEEGAGYAVAKREAPEADRDDAPRVVVSVTLDGRRVTLPAGVVRSIEACAARSPRAAGRIEFDVVAGPDVGATVTLRSNDTGEPGLGACLVDVLQTADLPDGWAAQTVRVVITVSPG